MSGRISDLAVYEANPAIYYVGTAHGGVWKTTSNGAMFEAQFQDKGLMSIGDVTVSQKDPNLVWIGTGESNNRQSTSWGDGVYKSTDGGQTWRNMGLRESRHINRIVIDPVDNNIVFVAATGPLWGAGGERGVYKTTDGGATWKLVLKGRRRTPAPTISCRRRPTATSCTPRCISASGRSAASTAAGPGSGIWKSTDLGETWTRLTNTTAAGTAGPHRARRVPQQREPRVRADRSRGRRRSAPAPDGRGGDVAARRGGAAGGGGAGRGPAAAVAVGGGRGGGARRRRQPERPLSIGRRRRRRGGG